MTTTSERTAGLIPGEPTDVLRWIPQGAKIVVPIGFGEPPTLLDTIEAHAEELDGVEIHRMDPFVTRPYIQGAYGTHLRHVDYFLGPGSRQAYWDGQCDLVPNHFSEVPLLLRRIQPDLAIARASGPNEHGYFSLGPNADYTAAFIGKVPFFLEVTEQQPFTYGQNQIHGSQIAGWIKTDAGFPKVTHRAPSPQDEAIAGHIAELIPDGACLQVGVGSIPDALLSALTDHKDLGIHTECLSDGLMNLVERGIATGIRKRNFPGKHVTTFCVGTRS